MVDKIHRQIVRYKGKRQDRWQGQTNKDQKMMCEELTPVLDEETMAAIAEEQERKIVRTKTFLISPMNPEEAVDQMELLGHNFFVFFNTATERVNVIYQRGDGDYGLLAPELA